MHISSAPRCLRRSRPLRGQKTTRRSSAFVILLIASACSTRSKPSELEAFERIRQSGNYEAAKRRAPTLVGDADRLMAQALNEWQGGDLEDSRRDALLGQIKMKHALSIVEDEQARARASSAGGALAVSDEEYGRLAKELTALNEQIALMQKLQETRS